MSEELVPSALALFKKKILSTKARKHIAVRGVQNNGHYLLNDSAILNEQKG